MGEGPKVSPRDVKSTPSLRQARKVIQTVAIAGGLATNPTIGHAETPVTPHDTPPSHVGQLLPGQHLSTELPPGLEIAETAATQSENSFERTRNQVVSANEVLQALAKTMRIGEAIDMSINYQTASVARMGSLRSLMQFQPQIRDLFLPDEDLATLAAIPDLSLETPANKPQVREGTLDFDHVDAFTDGRMISASYPILRGENPMDQVEVYSDRYRSSQNPTGEIDLGQIARGASVRFEGRMVGSAMFADRVTPIQSATSPR